MQKVEDVSSQKELATEVGFSVGKVNYVIKALLEKGFIKVENFMKSPNKKAYRYLLTADGLKNKIALTETYIAIKKLEYEKLQENLELDKKRNGDINLLLVFISENQSLSAKNISENMNEPLKTIQRWIKQLKDENKIEYLGSKKTGGYFVK